ncbi:hypothetical protein KSS87_018610 [Heliosperma pusillum]|nr:hypothetical protein KSS87_018610 [Heliosperma pusillum]
MSHIGRAGPPDITDTYSLLVLNISFRRQVDGREIAVQFAKYGPNAERIHKGRILEPIAKVRSPRPRLAFALLGVRLDFRYGHVMTTGTGTTTEEAAVEVLTGTIVTGTGKKTEVTAVAAGVAATVLATQEVGAMEADLLKVPLLQDEVGVHVEVLLPAESHLAIHLFLGVVLQIRTVLKHLLFLLVALSPLVFRAAPLLASQIRRRCLQDLLC